MSKRGTLVIVVLAALLLLQLALAIGSMRGDSATDDEPAHLVAGYLKLTQGAVSFYRYNPPLGDCLLAVPLLFTRIHLPANWKSESNPWNVGKALLYGRGNDADSVLFLARLPALVSFVALSFLAAWVAWRLTRSELATIVAYGLTAFCPNLMAHGRLATNDIEVTLLLFVAAILLIEWVKQPSWRNSVLASIAVAAALLTKVSALILAPWLLLLLWPHRHEWKTYTVRAAGLAALVAAEMDLFYVALMRRLSVTAPFHEYAATLDVIHGFVSSGFQKPQYLLGSFSMSGWWYYYPVAFLIKTTIPALLLILFAAVSAIFLRKPPGALFLFVALYAIASMTSSLALGLRYILPIYPFLYVAVACGVAGLASAVSGREKMMVTGGIALLLAGHIAAAASTYPNYIGYFNEMIGRRDSADLYLIDSNLDWGQDLGRLAAWVDANHIAHIDVDYFGGGDVRYYLGDRATLLDGPDPRRHRPGYFAVSKHFYRTSFFYRQYGLDYGQYFSGASKVTTINGSIDVWRIP
ncbi:MAG TPA: glycosyltransferase family 39 protein [Thermoanaerobaculia bacterium]